MELKLLGEKTTMGTDAGSEETREEGEERRGAAGVDMMYGLEDQPPWYLCIVLGMQVSLCLFYIESFKLAPFSASAVWGFYCKSVHPCKSVAASPAQCWEP